MVRVEEATILKIRLLIQGAKWTQLSRWNKVRVKRLAGLEGTSEGRQGAGGRAADWQVGRRAVIHRGPRSLRLTFSGMNEPAEAAAAVAAWPGAQLARSLPEG